MLSLLNRRRTRKPSRSRRKLLAERLDQRIVFAAIPAVTIDTPAEVFLGENVDVNVTFDNADASDAGFGPFIDVYLPTNGADGTTSGGTRDGLSYVANSATYLGTSVVTTVHTFDASGVFDHPYAVDSSGDPLQVTGAEGDQLLVFQLPFGSFTADQPGATVNFQTALSDQADLGTPLTLRTRSGFQYGNTPEDDFATDPSLVSQPAAAGSWTPTSPVTPILVELEKIYIGPENETATGPNFPRQYTINIDVADGQTITDVDLTDLLPNNVELLPGTTFTVTGSTTNTPVTPANAPNNDLTFNLPSIAGTTAAVDASVTFNYFVPFRDADGNTVLDADSGDDSTSPNNVALLGDWTPSDTRDAATVIDNVSIDEAGPEETFAPKSIAIQKSVALVDPTDPTDVVPDVYSSGDTVEYTLVFQISDYFGFDDIVIDDILSDGQRFDAGFSPTLTVDEHSTSSAGNVSPANFTVTDNFAGAGLDDGTQALQIRVSDELVGRTGGNALVLGGLVPVAGTGVGNDPDPANFDGGATTGTVTFRAIVQEDFDNDFPSGDASVDEGDELDNDVTITGDVFRYDTVTASGQTEADTSAAEFVIARGTLSKSIFAINGNTTLPSPLVLAPGDTITYRIGLTLPNSDIEDLRLDDFLPLPVLDATEVTSFDSDASVTPDAGEYKFGPSDTFSAIYTNSNTAPNPAFGSNQPTLLSDSVSNTLSFDYGDFDIDPSQSSTIDLLFTVTASSDPFADGLFLTNQVRRSQESTNAGTITNDSIVQIQLAEPDLNIKKGIVATTNADGVYSPTTNGPVTFTAPGTTGYRGGGTVNSAGLAANPIDSDLSLVDAGDLVTFAIVVENTGSSRKGAFDVQVRDALPPGFQIPAGGLNLNVSDGTGIAFTTTTIGSGLFDPSGGIELTDPGTTNDTGDGTDGGALDEFDSADGQNILIITYDLEVLASANPNQLLVSDATLFNYASIESGADFTTQNLTDPASTRVAAFDTAKALTATSEGSTTGNNVAIGEVITYTSTITVPEGDAANVVWTDTPDAGLAIVAVDSIVASPDVTSSVGAIAGLTPAIPADGSNASIDFGTLTNANRDNAVDETIVITYRAIVLNTTDNDRGDTRDNQAVTTWTGGSDTGDGPDVTIVEPELNIAKTISPATGQAADVFTVELVVDHTGGINGSNADAFGVTLIDVLPAGLNYNAGTLAATGLATTTLGESSGTITATWNAFPDDGSTTTITFNVTADAAVVAGATITNTASVDWSSLPGDQTTALTTNPLSVERTGDTNDPGTTANDHVDTDSDTVLINSPVLTKTIVTTNAAHTTGANVAIGEIVTYDVVFQVPNGTLPNAVFVDTPDSGLSIVGVTSVTANSTDLTTSVGTFADVANNAVIAAGGTSVTFDFDDLTNANTDTAAVESVTMRYTAVVVNQNLNDRDFVLDNQGELTWGTSNSVAVDGPDVTIVEPELSITVSNGTPATADAGDTVSWTIDVAHAGTSNADAFDVDLQNLINSAANNLSYIASSVVVTPAGGAVLGTSSDAGGDLALDFTEFPLGATASITFDTRVELSAPASTTLTNDAAIQWTSLPGDISTAQSSNSLSVERTGQPASGGTGLAQDDHDATDAGTITTNPPGAGKIVVATNQPDTGDGQHDPGVTDLLVGEEVTYEITASIPEGSNTLVITDTLPLGIEYVSAAVVSVGSSLTVGTPTITSSDRDGDTVDDTVAFDFGSVVNAPDGVADANDEVIVRVVGRVRDVAGNVNATVLTNSAEIDLSGAPATATADVEVVEPVLEILKTSPLSSGPPGTIEEFTLTIQHTGATTNDAYDLQIRDLLGDPNLTLIPGTVTTNRGTIVTGNDPSDTTIGIDLDQLAIGDTITIRYDASTNPAAGGPGVVIDTPGDLVWDSIPGVGGRVGNDTDPEPFTTTAPEVDLTVLLLDNGDTNNDDLDEIVVDDPFTYTVIVTNNGPSTATGTTVTTTLDPNTSSPSAVSTQGTNGIAGLTVTSDVGTLAPGQSETITITVNAPATAQTINSNSVVAANETETDNTNNDDPEPTVVRETGSIAGSVWVDLNQNGIIDVGEVPLLGTRLVLTGTDTTGLIAPITATTDATGAYLFDRLRPGTFEVRQLQPTLFLDGLDEVGTGVGSSIGNDATAVTIGPGDDETGYDFTERGLRPEYLGKRRLLTSNAGAPTPLAADDFFAIFAPSGGGDFDSDSDVDNDDYLLFLDRIGEDFVL